MARMRSSVAGMRKAVSGLLMTLTSMFDHYRPELHYMRGPGPKWHEKHSR